LLEEHKHVLNDEGREYLSIIVDSGRKIQAMMDGLLQYSRLNTRARPFTPVPVKTAIDKAFILLEKRIADSQATFEISSLPVIIADSDQLIQLFHALIDNALKFQPQQNNPQIKIDAQKIERGWQFSITDNGIGIDDSYRDKIFKLFQRLHSDHAYPGVGVGLTLALKIVQRHGGRIWHTGKPGKGSAFYFTLSDREKML
jgi:light-regulated signal transduction histidine kinase (bacteriophytochrome)